MFNWCHLTLNVIHVSPWYNKMPGYWLGSIHVTNCSHVQTEQKSCTIILFRQLRVWRSCTSLGCPWLACEVCIITDMNMLFLHLGKPSVDWINTQGLGWLSINFELVRSVTNINENLEAYLVVTEYYTFVQVESITWGLMIIYYSVVFYVCWEIWVFHRQNE